MRVDVRYLIESLFFFSLLTVQKAVSELTIEVYQVMHEDFRIRYHFLFAS